MAREKIIGIYKITNPKSKIYIGKSKNILLRWVYYNRLKCEQQFKLYRSLKKYGVDKHKFEIIHTCEEEQLNELEVYYIELYQCFNSKYGLNLQSGGLNGYFQSDETKEKIRKTNLGRKQKPESIQKMIQTRIDRGLNIFTEEHKKNMSKSRIGIKLSQETRNKIGNRILSQETLIKMSKSHKGIKHTEEQKRKISEACMGRIVSKEGRENMSKSKKGRLFTIEHKKKLSDARKGKTPWNKNKSGYKVPRKSHDIQLCKDVVKALSLAIERAETIIEENSNKSIGK